MHGVPKTRPLRLTAHIVKTPEPMYDFGRLQRRFILNASVNSIFISLIIQSSTNWRKMTSCLTLNNK